MKYKSLPIKTFCETPTKVKIVHLKFKLQNLSESNLLGSFQASSVQTRVNFGLKIGRGPDKRGRRCYFSRRRLCFASTSYLQFLGSSQKS